MIKKMIITTLLFFTFNISVNAEIMENLYEFEKDTYREEFDQKLNNFKIGDELKKYLKKIDVSLTSWYLADEIGDDRYYVQIDPMTAKISRIRIVSKYNEHESTKILIYLTELNGLPNYSYKEARFFNDDETILYYMDKDIFSNEKDKKMIIDIFNLKLNQQKEESETKLYLDKEMIRK